MKLASSTTQTFRLHSHYFDKSQKCMAFKILGMFRKNVSLIMHKLIYVKNNSIIIYNILKFNTTDIS